MIRQILNFKHSVFVSYRLINQFEIKPNIKLKNFSISFVQRLFSDRRFSEKHEWVIVDSKEKSLGTIGISNYAQEALGDVVYVQMPEIGADYNQDDEVGAVESVKAANEIYTPVSGTVVEINKVLEEKPGLINSSCYDEGWIFKIKFKDQKEIDALMDEKAYQEFLKTVQRE